MKLIIQDIDPRVTIGQLEMERIKTLERLTNEKLLDLNKQVQCSTVWQRLAIISSEQAAGYIDFINQLDNNGFGYSFQYTLFNAAMQGVHLEQSISDQLRFINQQSDQFDAIVIVRGGGAKLDLVGFDQYRVCKEIAQSSLPVLVGVGHEIDHVLADRVAYSYSKTPTAAAEYVMDRMLHFETILLRYFDQIQRQLSHQFTNEKLRIEQSYQRVQFALKSAFRSHRIQLESYEKIVNLLDPQSILDRGYAAVVNKNGELIRKLNDLDSNEKLTIHYQIRNATLIN